MNIRHIWSRETVHPVFFNDLITILLDTGILTILGKSKNEISEQLHSYKNKRHIKKKKTIYCFEDIYIVSVYIMNGEGINLQ